MGRLDSVEAEVKFDNLIISAGDVGTIELSAGQGVLAAGTVIDKDGAVFATGAVPYGVLTDETDAKEAVVATVYKTGHFVKNSIVTSGDIDATDIDALRTHGIFLEEALI